jgi:hypothetical protein
VRIRRPLAIGAVTAIATAIIGVATPMLIGSASAASNPPWEPDPNAIGTLTFFNSAGHQVTSGTDLSHLFDFAEASTTDPGNLAGEAGPGMKATLVFAAPAPNTPTGNFAASLGSGATNFPNASAPAPLNTTANPVVSLASTDANLTNFIASTVPQTAAGFANVYQIRLWTSGPAGVGTAPLFEYWDADVVVNPTAGTWQEEYPTTGTGPTSTTTTVSASPATSAQQGAAVTLTATETPAAAGSVEFDQVVQGTPSSLGTATVNATTGVATLTTSKMLPSAPSGANSATITATFTPSDTSSFSGSTSAPLPYTVNPVANKPTISGAHTAGKTESCSDGTLDFGVSVSFTWLASGKTIGTGSHLVVPGTAYKKSLQCKASVHDGSGPSNSALSNSVTVSRGGALKATRKPSLSGPHKVGRTERVSAGSWNDPGVSGVTFTYQWLLNGRTIRHATKSTFKPTRGDRGKKLSCRVTAHAQGFGNGSATTSSVRVS